MALPHAARLELSVKGAGKDKVSRRTLTCRAETGKALEMARRWGNTVRMSREPGGPAGEKTNTKTQRQTSSQPRTVVSRRRRTGRDQSTSEPATDRHLTTVNPGLSIPGFGARRSSHWAAREFPGTKIARCVGDTRSLPTTLPMIISNRTSFAFSCSPQSAPKTVQYIMVGTWDCCLPVGSCCHLSHRPAFLLSQTCGSRASASAINPPTKTHTNAVTSCSLVKSSDCRSVYLIWWCPLEHQMVNLSSTYKLVFLPIFPHISLSVSFSARLIAVRRGQDIQAQQRPATSQAGPRTVEPISTSQPQDVGEATEWFRERTPRLPPHTYLRVIPSGRFPHGEKAKPPTERLTIVTSPFDHLAALPATERAAVTAYISCGRATNSANPESRQTFPGCCAMINRFGHGLGPYRQTSGHDFVLLVLPTTCWTSWHPGTFWTEPLLPQGRPATSCGSEIDTSRLGKNSQTIVGAARPRCRIARGWRHHLGYAVVVEGTPHPARRLLLSRDHRSAERLLPLRDAAYLNLEHSYARLRRHLCLTALRHQFNRSAQSLPWVMKRANKTKELDYPRLHRQMRRPLLQMGGYAFFPPPISWWCTGVVWYRTKRMVDQQIHRACPPWSHAYRISSIEKAPAANKESTLSAQQSLVSAAGPALSLKKLYLFRHRTTHAPVRSGKPTPKPPLSSLLSLSGAKSGFSCTVGRPSSMLVASSCSADAKRSNGKVVGGLAEKGDIIPAINAAWAVMAVRDQHEMDGCKGTLLSCDWNQSRRDCPKRDRFSRVIRTETPLFRLRAISQLSSSIPLQAGVSPNGLQQACWARKVWLHRIIPIAIWSSRKARFAWLEAGAGRCGIWVGNDRKTRHWAVILISEAHDEHTYTSRIDLRASTNNEFHSLKGERRYLSMISYDEAGGRVRECARQVCLEARLLPPQGSRRRMSAACRPHEVIPDVGNCGGWVYSSAFPRDPFDALGTPSPWEHAKLQTKEYPLLACNLNLAHPAKTSDCKARCESQVWMTTREMEVLFWLLIMITLMINYPGIASAGKDRKELIFIPVFGGTYAFPLAGTNGVPAHPSRYQKTGTQGAVPWGVIQELYMYRSSLHGFCIALRGVVRSGIPQVSWKYCQQLRHCRKRVILSVYHLRHLDHQSLG
ncbi:hypothetical protein ACRALDRAFT_2018706 [Sodiomyces alcalophilus JCM 7366]|uniref:uncharacterized protein n=1 Tax=Sodiomyces alcalophilus JCM 7366 TaxID=591952 RepID=UPI0039B6C71B